MPPCYVTGGEHVRRTRLQKLVDRNPVVRRKSRPLSDRRVWPHSDAGDDQIRVQPRSVVENDGCILDRLRTSSEVKLHTSLLVDGFDETTQFRTEHPLERNTIRRHHTDIEPTRDERRCHLETDKAGTDDYRLSISARLADDRTRIGEASEIPDALPSGYAETNRTGPRRDEEATELERAAIAQGDRLRMDVDLTRFDSLAHLDALIPVKRFGMKREPVFRSIPGKVVLGKVWPVVRRVAIGIEKRHGPAITLPPQHLRTRISGSTGTDDHDGSRPGLR